MASLAPALALLLTAPTAPGRAEAPLPESPARGDCTRLAALRSALASPETRRQAVEAVAAELRRVPPVAWIEGFWATPFDLSVLADAGPGRDEPHVRPLLGLAFIPEALRAAAALPFVGELARPGVDAPPEAAILLLPASDPTEALLEYLPPPTAGEPECVFFCGDPAGWDFDADGAPNAADPDDDNDGFDDVEDAFPYWPQLAACDCEGRSYVGVTGKFSEAVRDAVLAAHAARERGAEPVLLGTLGESAAEARLLFPADAWVCPPADACPDPEAEGVHYVSRDPADCARLRFRCEPGTVPFSDACGCGCAAE